MSSRSNKATKASKSSKSSKHAEVKQWGNWEWAEDQGQHYRYRCAYNELGEVVDTQYDTQYYLPDNVPREPGDSVEHLTTSLGETSLGETTIGETSLDERNISEEHYTLGQSLPPDSEDTGAYDRKGKSKAISPEAQGVSGPTPDQPYTTEPATESTQDDIEDPFYTIDSRGPLADGEEQVEGGSAEPDGGYVDTPGAYLPAADGTTYADYDSQIAAAMLASKKDASRLPKPGQSSTGQNLGDMHGYTPQAPGYAAADGYSAYGEAETLGYDEPSSAYADEAGGYLDEAYEEETANAVPEMSRLITGTSGDHELTDPRFTLMNSQYWQPGTVFKILWAEPQGQSKAKNAGTFFTERHTIDNGAGKSFHVKLRRFIIYGTGEGQSTCVPIFTYNNQGCKKSGVKPENHGIVHDYNLAPRMLPGEPPLGFDPAAIVLTEATEKITKDSRVNYSQLMTVQHNVKIFIIGYTDQDSFQIVRAAVDHCFGRLSTSFGGAPKSKSNNPKKEKGVRRHHRR